MNEWERVFGVKSGASSLRVYELWPSIKFPLYFPSEENCFVPAASTSYFILSSASIGLDLGVYVIVEFGWNRDELWQLLKVCMYVLEFLSQHRAQCVCCPKIIITSTFSTFPFPIITQLVSLVLSKRSIILKNLLLSLLFGYRSRVFSGEQRLVGRGLVVCIIRYGENFVS